MFAIVVAGVAGPAWADDVGWLRAALGIPIAIVGAILFIGGMVGIRGSLTPFPRPLEHARLREGGAYRFVRHPIYGGLFLIAFGWSLVSSPLALVATVALLLVLEAKSRLEESMLEQRFPEYAAYRARVRWRFVPGIH
ncbi:MAG TPA: isoprenylcysteine carboxylmethyltransferase family protein [Actinomycetota bacterium]|nr:isoprenylcysteine carboxylmethyltransferase family protein [Actinomycetota bacterium]